MSLVRLDDARAMQDKLRREIERAPEPVREIVQVPLRGAIEAALLIGDVMLRDPADDGRTDRGGTFVWLHGEPTWDTAEEIWIPHIWGESTKHYQILLDLCQWGVDNNITLPVKYGLLDHPINVIATRWFVTERQIERSDVGGIATTTFAEALALGLANQRAFERSRLR